MSNSPLQVKDAGLEYPSFEDVKNAIVERKGESQAGSAINKVDSKRYSTTNE